MTLRGQSEQGQGRPKGSRVAITSCVPFMVRTVRKMLLRRALVLRVAIVTVSNFEKFGDCLRLHVHDSTKLLL